MLPYVKINTDVSNLVRGSEHAAGLDLTNAGYDTILWPKSNAAFDTGVKVAIPEGYFGLVTIRSGLAFKHGLSAHIGVIDADYRGEIRVLLFNTSESAVRIESGQRIAQLIIVPYLHCVPSEVDTLPSTERGEGGFGSTGRKEIGVQ